VIQYERQEHGGIAEVSENELYELTGLKIYEGLLKGQAVV